jgi:surfeit locus 1 family protein
MILKKMFGRGWLIATLLVFTGTAICIRLGIWQLDRLELRRAFNAQVESMRAADMLDLNQDIPVDIASMEWRAVTVTGEYDFENQTALRNQYYSDQYGYHLITPLLFNGTAVLVDRGWIPADGNASPADWRKYDEAGQVTLTGQIRLGSGKPAFGGVADALPEAGQTLLQCGIIWMWRTSQSRILIRFCLCIFNQMLMKQIASRRSRISRLLN